jgi:predicted DNA-binding ribbon-helix-helix protein
MNGATFVSNLHSLIFASTGQFLEEMAERNSVDKLQLLESGDNNKGSSTHFSSLITV